MAPAHGKAIQTVAHPVTNGSPTVLSHTLPTGKGDSDNADPAELRADEVIRNRLARILLSMHQHSALTVHLSQASCNMTVTIRVTMGTPTRTQAVPSFASSLWRPHHELSTTPVLLATQL